MFEELRYDSLSVRSSGRGWSTLASFSLQALALSLLLTLPLLHVEGIPKLPAVAHLLVPASPAASSTPQAATRPQSRPGGLLIVRPALPPNVLHFGRDTSAAPFGMNQLEVSHQIGDPRLGSWIPGSIGNGTNSVLPPPPATVAHPLRISRMMEGNLILRVQPEYPPLARQVRIQGPVVLHALIAKDGSIENLQALSGHPTLIPAAIAAVRQWRYRPYLLN